MKYYVYILASESGTLYTGVTNNLERRMYEHRNGLVEGFTKKYNCKKLVFFEEYLSIIDALNREKQIKKWRRSKKEWLIKTVNSTWRDLLTD
ncbi:MAG TPA: GIY-YIG nuclease family protein [Patescibacteria group bacterium]|nr:GIY-YIG nuclease family protein [Patescibacteria group bacterium]